MSDGRDIGVVFNLPRKSGACVLPVCGGVGTQYTPGGRVGPRRCAIARSKLGDKDCGNSIAVAHGGEASTATNGFWSALNIVDHRAAAVALLHRGQWLRHLGAVAAADTGRQHRRATSKAFADCA